MGPVFLYAICWMSSQCYNQVEANSTSYQTFKPAEKAGFEESLGSEKKTAGAELTYV